jgi:hypothetical protein
MQGKEEAAIICPFRSVEVARPHPPHILGTYLDQLLYIILQVLARIQRDVE